MKSSLMKSRCAVFASSLACVLLLLSCMQLGADGRVDNGSRIATYKSRLTLGRSRGGEQLGAVSFQTSCAPAVQKTFDRAVALLHSFQYQEAEEAFQAVAQQDPKCAMAYWGVAMTLYHQLWEPPDKETLTRGLEAVEKAKSLGSKTDREREYMAATATFYQDSSKLDHDAGAASYAKAMEQLHAHYPQDREAATFYALSLLGEEPQKDDRLANRKKAAAILEPLFKEEPNHPGAAHYLIHAYDTPELAQLGLPAARRYAKIAPSSSHALHMPSHIFSRLGLWQDSIESNLAAIKAAEMPEAVRIGGVHYATHAMDFLQYAYLQSGREADARNVIADVAKVPGADSSAVAQSQADFQVRYEIELHHWSKAASLVAPPDNHHTGLHAYIGWARVIGAARTGDPVGARKDLEQLDALDAAKHDYPASYAERERQEAAAWLAFAEGKRDEAINMMRSAADREDASGPEQLAVPAREMLGDMLLELRQPAEALAAYETSLRVAPNRFDGLYGAARAAELAGDTQKATAYYSQLLKNCDAGAHCDRPEFAQAKALLARR